MKNPMTTTEMQQANDDNAAGCDMQWKSNRNPGANWKDRIDRAGKPLNFSDYQYRRKPEPQERYILEYKSGSIVTHKTYAGALLADSQNALIRVTRVIEDPDWVEPEPEDKPVSDKAGQKWDIPCFVKLDNGNTLVVTDNDGKRVEYTLSRPWDETSVNISSRKELPEEDPNPWRKIIKGEWPECDPRKRITLSWEGGSHTADYTAGKIDWDCTTAIVWRYAGEK